MAVPQALIQSLQQVKGFRQEAFEQVHDSGEQVVSIRLNPSKPIQTDYLPIAGNVPWCSNGRYLSERPLFTFDPLLHAGAYYVQEASSMFVWQALEQHMPETAGKKMLDLCAAPGGKSTLLSSYGQDALLVSNEVIKSRASILVENTIKWGDPHTVVTNNDPAHFASLPGFFDLILVDAPCSGSGLFRKDPAAIEEWSEAGVALCSQRQQRILADIIPALAENGLLIYATCSYSPAEDEEICDWLVEEFGMESLPIRLDSKWGIIESFSARKGASGYRFFPDQVKGEGFFLACFRYTGSPVVPKFKSVSLPTPSKKDIQQIHADCLLKGELSFFLQQTEIRCMESRWMQELSQLAAHLYIKKAGIELGSLKGKGLVPSHELAMSPILQGGYPTIDVELEQALQYLRRQDLTLKGEIGWNLIGYQGLSLGWVKVLPNRVNNYYPSEWRILKG